MPHLRFGHFVALVALVAVGSETLAFVDALPEWAAEVRWVPWGAVLAAIAAAIVRGSVRLSGTELSEPETEEAPVAEPRHMASDPAPPNLPPLPPIYCYPTPFPPAFAGRIRHRAALTDWYRGRGQPIFILSGAHGIGKSTLARVWLAHDVLGEPLGILPPEDAAKSRAGTLVAPERPEAVFWWSFRLPGGRFDQFLDAALEYADPEAPSTDPAPTTAEKIGRLIELLTERRTVLVLDGFEQELRGFASSCWPPYVKSSDEGAWDDCICLDHHASEFLMAAAALRGSSRVLVTSYRTPKELEGRSGTRAMTLSGLGDDEAKELLRFQGLHGSEMGMLRATRFVTGHPLSLNLLAATALVSRTAPGDLDSVVSMLDPQARNNRLHVLQFAFEAIEKSSRALLCRLGAVLGPIDSATPALFTPDLRGATTEGALEDLFDRRLLLRVDDRNGYDLHPIIRVFVYGRLADAEGAHTRLRNHFEAIKTVQEDRIDRHEDLAPIIGRYLHTARSGDYDLARKLYRDRLLKPLTHRFADFELAAELLCILFPYGFKEARPLENAAARDWALNELAGAYSFAGRVRPSAEILQLLTNRASLSGGGSDSLMIYLGALADEQMRLGKLADADANLRLGLKLCRPARDEIREASCRRRLGRLLSVLGRFDEATTEIEAAMTIATRVGLDREVLGSYVARAQQALLRGNRPEARRVATKASDQAAKLSSPDLAALRDALEAEVIGAMALIAEQRPVAPSDQEHDQPTQARLDETLARCRRSNMVELEARALFAGAAHSLAEQSVQDCFRQLQHAMVLADRCQLRLLQADLRNFAARFFLQRGDRAGAQRHAEAARDLVYCDDPRFSYRPALDAAKRFLS